MGSIQSDYQQNTSQGVADKKQLSKNNQTSLNKHCSFGEQRHDIKILFGQFLSENETKIRQFFRGQNQVQTQTILKGIRSLCQSNKILAVQQERKYDEFYLQETKNEKDHSKSNEILLDQYSQIRKQLEAIKKENQKLITEKQKMIKQFQGDKQIYQAEKNLNQNISEKLKLSQKKISSLNESLKKMQMELSQSNRFFQQIQEMLNLEEQKMFKSQDLVTKIKTVLNDSNKIMSLYKQEYPNFDENILKCSRQLLDFWKINHNKLVNTIQYIDSLTFNKTNYLNSPIASSDDYISGFMDFITSNSEQTNSKIRQLEQKIRQITNSNKQSKNYANIKKANDELLRGLDLQKNNNKHLTSEIIELKKQNNKAKQANNFLQNQKIKLVKQKENQIQILMKKLEEKQCQLKESKQLLNQKDNQEIYNLKQQLQTAQKEIENVSHKFINMTKQLKDILMQSYNQKINPQINQLELLTKFIQTIKQKIFTAGGYQSIQNLHSDNIQQLIQKLYIKKGKQPTGLKMLFKKDHFNKANFHSYLDNKEDILMTVCLKNDCIVGGYTHQPINFGTVPGTGFIFSFTKQRKIFLQIKEGKKNARIITPEENYIIFGMSELRINPNSEVINCNVGIPAQYFNGIQQQVKGADFLGSDKKQAEIKSCQFYQVLFG